MTRTRLAMVVGLSVAAWAAALGAIAGLRPAALYRQSTHEGVMFLWPLVLWLLSWFCGLAAVGLITGFDLNRLRGRGVLVGAALLGPVLASVLGYYVEKLDLSHCWRTCAPFPH